MEQINRLATLIKEHKPELLAYLQSGSDQPPHDDCQPPQQVACDRESTRSIQRLRHIEKMHPRAVAWLADHRTALKAAGWTAKELYRRNRSPGVGWSRLWKKEDLKVVLEPSGRIVFTFSDALGSNRSPPPHSTQKKIGQKKKITIV
ncbi:hypothetical protein [Candidatus Electrothrix sp.]|uniref:hypothetical protein n=1 Tax=Candidatus Electrothrix sp. TaxID=2170559 RepID=UPI0040579FC9